MTNRDVIRNIVSRLSRGNRSLMLGNFIASQDMVNVRRAIQARVNNIKEQSSKSNIKDIHEKI